MADEVIIDLKKLKKYKITPTQYVIAYLIHNKNADEFVELQKLAKDNYAFKKDLLELIKKNIIESDAIETGKFEFKDARINDLFGEIKEEVSFDDFVNEFRKLFPSGVKSGGYYVRSSEKDCEKKLRKFMKDYSYNKETILEATQEYIYRSRLSNYQYIKIAVNFISKDGTSILASECDQILNKEEDGENTFGGSILSGGL